MPSSLREKDGNPLKKWRQAAGLSPQEASRRLEMLLKDLEDLESRTLDRIPLKHLAGFIRTYKVSPVELARSLPRLEDLFSADR